MKLNLPHDPYDKDTVLRRWIRTVSPLVKVTSALPTEQQGTGEIYCKFWSIYSLNCWDLVYFSQPSPFHQYPAVDDLFQSFNVVQRVVMKPLVTFS